MRRVRDEAKRVDIARVTGRMRRSNPRRIRRAPRATSTHGVGLGRCGASTVNAAFPTVRTPARPDYSLKR